MKLVSGKDARKQSNREPKIKRKKLGKRTVAKKENNHKQRLPLLPCFDDNPTKNTKQKAVVVNRWVGCPLVLR
jgi:hypothetical protein